MFESLKRLLRRKKPAQPQKRESVPPSTGYTAGRSPATGRPDPMLDPLNPLSPISPLHPLNQVNDCEPVRQHVSSTSSCSDDSSSSWSSSDSGGSSSSSDSGSSSSNCD